MIFFKFLGVGDVIRFSLFNNVNPSKRNAANVKASSSQDNQGNFISSHDN